MGGTAPPLPLSPLAALGGSPHRPSGHPASLPSPLPSGCPSSSCIVCAPVVTGRSSGVAGCAAPFTTPCRAWWLGHSAPAAFYLPSIGAAQPHSTRPAVKTPACTVACSAYQSCSARTTTSRPPVLAGSARHCGASLCSLPQRLAGKLPASPSAGGHGRHTPPRRPFRPGGRVACAPCGGGGTHAT